MTPSSGSLLLGVLCLYLYNQGSILRLAWLSLTILETFRALRTIRPNGRKIGIATRRKAVRQALIGWIVFHIVSQVEPCISSVLGWLPFYSPVKWLVSLAFLVARIPASTAIYTSTIRPLFKQYEKPIDLILLLLQSVFQVFTYFAILLPLHHLRDAYRGVYKAIAGWIDGGLDVKLGTPPTLNTITGETIPEMTDVDINTLADISLSTPNVPGRLVSSAPKRAVRVRGQPISRAEVGESSRTHQEHQVACSTIDFEIDATGMDRLPRMTPLMHTQPRNLSRPLASIDLKAALPAAFTGTADPARRLVQESKTPEIRQSSVQPLTTDDSLSAEKAIDNEPEKQPELRFIHVPKDPLNRAQEKRDTSAVQTDLSPSSTDYRPVNTAFTCEGPISRPLIKPTHPPLPPSADSKSNPTSSSTIRKRPLAHDTSNRNTDGPHPPARSKRKLGPPIRVLLDPPKPKSTTAERRSTFVCPPSRSAARSSTESKSNHPPVRTSQERGVSRRAAQPRVLFDKNAGLALESGSQEGAKKVEVGIDIHGRRSAALGGKRAPMEKLENPTMKRVRKTV